MRNGFMSVNVNSGAGKAFLRSLYLQYAEWGVDFGKLTVINKKQGHFQHVKNFSLLFNLTDYICSLEHIRCLKSMPLLVV